MIFIHFASKNQLTLAWNGLITKEVLTFYKSTICFRTPICYILAWVDIAWLKFINHYLGSAGVVASTFAFHRYCPSSNNRSFLIIVWIFLKKLSQSGRCIKNLNCPAKVRAILEKWWNGLFFVLTVEIIQTKHTRYTIFSFIYFGRRSCFYNSFPYFKKPSFIKSKKV